MSHLQKYQESALIAVIENNYVAIKSIEFSHSWSPVINDNFFEEPKIVLVFRKASSINRKKLQY